MLQKMAENAVKVNGGVGSVPGGEKFVIDSKRGFVVLYGQLARGYGSAYWDSVGRL
jgi:hypothetical protein